MPPARAGSAAPTALPISEVGSFFAIALSTQLRPAALGEAAQAQDNAHLRYGASYTPGIAFSAGNAAPSRVCGHGMASSRSNRA